MRKLLKKQGFAPAKSKGGSMQHYEALVIAAAGR